jgi:hypothetical protein
VPLLGPFQSRSNHDPRYWSHAALGCLHRILAVDEWLAIKASGAGADSFEMPLAILDLFVLGENEHGDIDDVSQARDVSATRLKLCRFLRDSIHMRLQYAMPILTLMNFLHERRQRPSLSICYITSGLASKTTATTTASTICFSESHSSVRIETRSHSFRPSYIATWHVNSTSEQHPAATLIMSTH